MTFLLAVVLLAKLVRGTSYPAGIQFSQNNRLLRTRTNSGEIDVTIEERLENSFSVGDRNCPEASDTERYFADKPRGTIHWTGEGNSSSESSCHYFVKVSPCCEPSGVEVLFETVRLRRGETPERDDQVLVTNVKGKVLRWAVGDLPVQPLYILNTSLVIHIITHDRPEGHQELKEPCSRKSTFTLTFTRYSTKYQPSGLRPGYLNCSSIRDHGDVDMAVHCDMARQCLDGKDESPLFNCSYHHPHCAPGEIFVNLSDVSACMTVVYPGTQRLSWAEAMLGCPAGSSMIYLPGPEFTETVSRVIAVSGFTDAYVGLLTNVESYLEDGVPYNRFVPYTLNKYRDYNGYPPVQLLHPTFQCTVLTTIPAPSLRTVPCEQKARMLYFCLSNVTVGNRSAPGQGGHASALNPPSKHLDQFPVKRCHDGSLVHLHFPCVSADGVSGPLSPSNLPLLSCSNGNVIHYTLACNGHDDCRDGTDEYGCLKADFGKTLDDLTACPWSQEKIHTKLLCNGFLDCFGGGDEEGCRTCPLGLVPCDKHSCIPESYLGRGGFLCNASGAPGVFYKDPVVAHHCLGRRSRPKIARLDLDGYGLGELTEMGEGEQCPETHFQCPAGLCIPSFLVNNGDVDCPFPHANDEDKSLNCSGYYRCFQTSVCLHPDYVCDGQSHCPMKDDERYCNPVCPPNCTCEGFAYTCSQTYDAAIYPWARYLDLSGSSNLDIDRDTFRGYIELLNLSSSGVSGVGLERALVLKVLDLSSNGLTNLKQMRWRRLPLLEHLNLSHNDLGKTVFTELPNMIKTARMVALKTLTLQNTGLRVLQKTKFNIFPSLTHLDLRYNFIKHIGEGAFVMFALVTHLDLRGNPIKSYDLSLFRGLENIIKLQVDDPNLCCIYYATYPDKACGCPSCHAPTDELSSCSDLLSTNFHRVCLWVFSFVVILGNLWVFVYRVRAQTGGLNSVFGVLVANLCLSDLLMGVYLMIVGSADAFYRGQFAWNKLHWTQSFVCKTAGVVALVSWEVSSFIICFITLERVLVLRFPHSKHVFSNSGSVVGACGVAWAVGIALAILPLMPFIEWKVYSQTGICVPLPITRQKYPGQKYAFGIFIVFNFVLFLVIVTGQLTIYRVVRTRPLSDRTRRSKQDLAIAGRLIVIVFSSFCCWLPMGVMGLLAQQGTSIPGEVNVWAAVFVLPLNSAINPFLYTLHTLLERRMRKQQERRIQRIMDNLYVDMATWPVEKLDEIVSQVEILKNRQAAQRSRPSSLADTSRAPSTPPESVKSDLLDFLENTLSLTERPSTWSEPADKHVTSLSQQSSMTSDCSVGRRRWSL